MQTKFRILAAFGAILLAGLTFFAASKGLTSFVAWFDRLSTNERIVLRMLCLAVPTVVLPLSLVLRRRRQAREELLAAKSIHSLGA